MALTAGEDRTAFLDDLFDDEIFQDLDKAWYAMHRTLANYPQDFEGLDDEIDAKHGTYPLKLAIYGGQDIYPDDDGSWILRLIEPDQIADLVQAMEALDEKSFRQKYWATSSEEIFPEYGEEDLEYTFAYFGEARDFLKRMVGTGRTVIFLADQ